MTRPRKQSPGSALRDALARQNAREESDALAKASEAQRAAKDNLSGWFNIVANDMRDTVKNLSSLAKTGEKFDPEMSYSAPTEMLRGTGGASIESLDGFKKLAAASKELDVETTVTQGRHGYGRKINAGKPYLHVTIDVSKPYTPLAAEKDEPVTAKRPHHRPHRHNGYGHGRR